MDDAVTVGLLGGVAHVLFWRPKLGEMEGWLHSRPGDQRARGSGGFEWLERVVGVLTNAVPEQLA